MVEADLLRLHWRPFRFSLPRELVTAHGALREKAGWLLKLEAPDGRLGWGEAASLDWGAEAAGGSAVVGVSDPIPAAVACLGAAASRETLERRLPLLPPPLAFALGLALAELDGLGAGDGGWLPAPMSAQLLPAGEAMRAALERILRGRDAEAPVPRSAITFKWKVAAGEDRSERELLDWLLEQLPQDARLRLDANGGWDRTTAAAWASRLEHERRLDWLEQPLEPADREGLLQLAERLPVALDESVRAGRLPAGWPGWQVRRPAVEGDPRPLDPLGVCCGQSALGLEAWVSRLPDAIWQQPTARACQAYGQAWFQHEQRIQALLDQRLAETCTEPSLARQLSRLLPEGVPVVMANSSPVRDWESFGDPAGPQRPVFGFRGASGIDGTLSLACGVAQALGQAVLITGDLALLHDSNGWLWRRQLRGRLTVVLINNGGGGIFEQLPIRLEDQPLLDFERLFAMPQDVDALALAAAYGVQARRLQQWTALEMDLAWALEQPMALLEVATGRRHDAHQRQALRRMAHAQSA